MVDNAMLLPLLPFVCTLSGPTHGFELNHIQGLLHRLHLQRVQAVIIKKVTHGKGKSSP